MRTLKFLAAGLTLCAGCYVSGGHPHNGRGPYGQGPYAQGPYGQPQTGAQPTPVGNANVPRLNPWIRPVGTGATTPNQPGDTIPASADTAISAAWLGVPFDSRFRPFQGSAGTTLFPNAGAPMQTTVTRMDHAMIFADSEDRLAANASAWGIGELSTGLVQSRRFASYQAQQIEYVVELNDRTPMRPPPQGAVYYPWKIYYGRSYDVVFSGDAQSFHAGVKADLWSAVSIDIQSFAESHHIQATMKGRGLAPKDPRAIFARTPKDVDARYRQTSQPVPIFVEFRQIPGRVGLTTQVQWAPAPAAASRFLATLRIMGNCPGDVGGCDYSCSIRSGNTVLVTERGPQDTSDWAWTPSRVFSAQEFQTGLSLSIVDLDAFSNDSLGGCLIQRGSNDLAKWSNGNAMPEQFGCGAIQVQMSLRPAQ